MKIFAQNSRCPSQVLFAFDEVADASVQQVRWAVAYSTRRGCERLVDHISTRMGKSRWEKSEKRFITSLDFGLTDPGALEFLAGLPESKVYIANPQVVSKPDLLPGKAYHPKLYLFDAADSTGYVVGSANLTDSALIANTEVVVVGKEKPENATWNDVWDELLFDTAPLTTALLGEYRRKWGRPKRRAVEPDPKPRPPAIRPGDKPVFWEAITTGGISPMAFNHFWVEAGSMSSGGSYNQLELPRGANRFFGFTHTDYGAGQIPIGHRTLTFGRESWKNKLVWHGRNKMERINLPTVKQGGFDYQDTAVLFRRHEGGYEINVLPWDDDGAAAWRAASDALNTVFRLGGKGERICGLF
ncbi:MAG: phospholipase D family protein [Verrucomicrobiales bacterium]|nr:phospholipase D family protein [Verrucomicrobiales bacterium]